MAKKARIKSKSEKALLSKKYRLNAKKKPLQKEINKVRNLDARKKYLFEGKKRNKKTIVNMLVNKMMKINNDVYSVDQKVVRYNKKYSPKNNYRKELNDKQLNLGIAHVWERDKVEAYLLGKPNLKYKGKTMRQDADFILDALQDVFNNMTSGDTFFLSIDRKGNFDFSIQDEIDEDDI